MNEMTGSALSKQFVNIYTIDNAHKLDMFLQHYENIDFANFQNLKEKCESSFDWQKYFDDLETFRILLLAYQRLVKILPEKDMKVIHFLFKKGIHSAIQIASIPPSVFYSLFDDLKLDNLKIPDKIYENAMKQRNTVNLMYLDYLQKNEPYYKNARFNNVKNRDSLR